MRIPNPLYYCDISPDFSDFVQKISLVDEIDVLKSSVFRRFAKTHPLRFQRDALWR